MEIIKKDATEIRDLLRSGDLSAQEVTEAFLDRIEKTEPVLNAFITVTADLAVKTAAEIDSGRRSGDDVGPLGGVPIALKDALSTRGIKTTCGSRMLEDYVPVYDATAVQKLIEAGAVITGKCNLDEFAMGSSTESSFFGITRNPWDTERVPGGSSGGPAAAVASGQAPWALGTDTGGSVRQPSAFCGLVGLKPTYGLVSRYGLLPLASSFDQVGTITRNVADCALLLGIVSGRDRNDSTSVDRKVPDYLSGLQADLSGKSIGVVREISGKGIDKGVMDRFNEAVELLQRLGARCEEVSLPSLSRGFYTYYVLSSAEASSNLSRLDGVRYGHRVADNVSDVWEMYDRSRAEGFGEEVKRRILFGTYVLTADQYEAYFVKAQKVRTMVILDFERAWESFDLLVSPTAPSTAFRIGEKGEEISGMYTSDDCTCPANLAGIPALSMPCGLSEGLPVGLQIMAPRFAEQRLLNVAHTLEQELRFELRPGAVE